MSTLGSITVWINQLCAGDDAAAQKLWEQYFHRLVELARAKPQGAARVVEDEEDVALSAFNSFCRGVREGRFTRLLDRDHLWQLLMVITVRKAVNLAHKGRRQKRGGGRVEHASTLPPEELAQVLGREPTPELAAQVVEECQRLLDSLKEPHLREVARWKLEGFSNEEIAAKLGRSLPTVERKLRRIREQWAREVEEPT